MYIDKFAPFHLAQDWDNSGLLVGDPDDEVKKIAVCLDVTFETVIEAANHGCNVIVSHHPLIFKPAKRIVYDSNPGDVIIEAVRQGISIIAVHTNWDVAKDGVNDTLAKLLGLQKVCVLDSESGLGSCGNLKKPMEIPDFLSHVKKSWGLSQVNYYSLVDMAEISTISRVALCGGSGAGLWREAADWEADIYLTADMKYHELMEALHENLAIGLVDHGEMERASLPELARKISRCGAETITLDVNALPSPLRI